MTYRPHPLYPAIQLSAEIQNLITQVAVTLGRLDGMTQLLPDPTILIRSFVRREAQLSSYIENTYAKYDELAQVSRAKDQRRLSEQAFETLNVERAIMAGVEAVVERRQPVTNALIRGLHEILLKRVSGRRMPGKVSAEASLHRQRSTRS